MFPFGRKPGREHHVNTLRLDIYLKWCLLCNKAVLNPLYGVYVYVTQPVFGGLVGPQNYLFLNPHTHKIECKST